MIIINILKFLVISHYIPNYIPKTANLFNSSLSKVVLLILLVFYFCIQLQLLYTNILLTSNTHGGDANV